MLKIHIHNVEHRNESNLYQLAVLEIMQVINFETPVLVSFYKTQKLYRTSELTVVLLVYPKIEYNDDKLLSRQENEI